MSRYLNPFTDFGFKKIFGSENSQKLLISFLNEILPNAKIKTLEYKKTEHLGQTDLDRKVIYDLYCQNEQGEKFIVELQKAKQSFFKDRALFYSTFPIQEQAIKGDWDYKLKSVYTVAILDFCFEDQDRKSVKVNVKLMDTLRKTVFYDKLTFVYLQMPNFEKNESELQTLEDKWLFILRNLAVLDNRPNILADQIFDDLFHSAELSQLSANEKFAYEESLKYYRDVKNSLDTAFADGKVEGLEEGEHKKAIKMAEKCIKEGLSLDLISKLTELSLKEVEEIAKKLGIL